MNENSYIKRFVRGIRILSEMTYPYRYKGEAQTVKQRRMLRDMLKYAVEHCEFYSKLGNLDCDFKKFPLMSKQTVRDNYNELISDEKDRFIYWDAYTGGSTGEPLHFLAQSCIDLPYQYYLWKKNGYRYGDVIVALTGAKVSEEDLERNIFWASENKHDIPYGRIEMSSLYFNEETAPYYIEYLNSLKPKFLRGYPSFVYEISKYILDNDIVLDFKPTAIELTSESSFEYQHNAIKQAFRTEKVFLQYGHTESSVFGYTYDDTYEYIIEPLYGYVEILDDEGNEVSEGEEGEIVVTSLYNKVMPIIRYKTGDCAIKGKTRDGKLHLVRITGRTQDYIYDRSNNRILLTALIFGQHFSALGNIVKWQIEQFEPGNVTMHIIKSHSYTQSDETEIKEIFDKLGNVDVIFDYVDNILPTPRGKSMMLVQHI